LFQQHLFRNLEKKENKEKRIREQINESSIPKNKNIINNDFNRNINNSYDQKPRIIGNAEILEQQRIEMEYLLKEEERKNKKKAEEELRKKTEVLKIVLDINFYYTYKIKCLNFN